jgi:hypothetical protein
MFAGPIERHSNALIQVESSWSALWADALSAAASKATDAARSATSRDFMADLSVAVDVQCDHSEHHRSSTDPMAGSAWIGHDFAAATRPGAARGGEQRATAPASD